MNFFKKILFVLLLMSINNSYSQKIDENKLPALYNEVYSNSPYVLTPSVEKKYKGYLNRVSFIVEKKKSNEQYVLLSSVSHKDKYNPNLNYDLDNFKIEDFNPFKYHFNFNSTEDQIFRVDSTDFLLLIKGFN